MSEGQQPAASVFSPSPIVIGAFYSHRTVADGYMEVARPDGELTMFKITMLAVAATILAAPAFAQEGKMALGEGDAVFIGADGTMQKSTTKVSDIDDEAALAKGANELSRGTVLYRHGERLYNVSCVGTYIGDWKHGYPGTESSC
jgi:hypothetical protein